MSHDVRDPMRVKSGLQQFLVKCQQMHQWDVFKRQTHHHSDGVFAHLLLQAALLAESDTVLAYASTLHLNSTTNHALDEPFGLGYLFRISSIIINILVEVAITNVALDCRLETNLASFLLAGHCGGKPQLRGGRRR